MGKDTEKLPSLKKYGVPFHLIQSFQELCQGRRKKANWIQQQPMADPPEDTLGQGGEVARSFRHQGHLIGGWESFQVCGVESGGRYILEVIAEHRQPDNRHKKPRYVFPIDENTEIEAEESSLMIKSAVVGGGTYSTLEFADIPTMVRVQHQLAFRIALATVLASDAESDAGSNAGIEQHDEEPMEGLPQTPSPQPNPPPEDVEVPVLPPLPEDGAGANQ